MNYKKTVTTKKIFRTYGLNPIIRNKLIKSLYGKVSVLYKKSIILFIRYIYIKGTIVKVMIVNFDLVHARLKARLNALPRPW